MRLIALAYRTKSTSHDSKITAIINEGDAEISIGMQHVDTMAMLAIVATSDGALTLTYDKPGRPTVVSHLGRWHDNGDLTIHEPVIIPSPPSQEDPTP